MKKIIKIINLMIIITTLCSFTMPVFAENKDPVISTVQKMIDQRIEFGFKKFNDLKPAKVIKMKGILEKENKFLVELENDNKELAGYIVVDTSTHPRIIEMSLGNTHPLLNVKNPVYYLGPLSYAEDISNDKVVDILSKREIDKSEMKRAIREENKNNHNKVYQPKVQVTILAHTDDDYDYINGVPDYQQNDNTSMNNDCVPTSGANVVMYWDSHSYPNLSSSDNWKNVADRLGELMGHTDQDGVSRSNIVPGLEDYFSEKGYGTSFSISRDTSPSFNDMDAQVESGNPAMLSFNNYKTATGGHNVTLVGTEIYFDTLDLDWHKVVIVHDNWESTGTDVWIWNTDDDFSEIDDMYSIED